MDAEKKIPSFPQRKTFTFQVSLAVRGKRKKKGEKPCKCL